MNGNSDLCTGIGALYLDILLQDTTDSRLPMQLGTIVELMTASIGMKLQSRVCSS